MIATYSFFSLSIKEIILPKKKPEAADYMPIIKGYESLGEKLMALSNYLPLEYFPKLVGEATRLKG